MNQAYLELFLYLVNLNGKQDWHVKVELKDRKGQENLSIVVRYEYCNQVIEDYFGLLADDLSEIPLEKIMKNLEEIQSFVTKAETF